MIRFYFTPFENRQPPAPVAWSDGREFLFQVLASCAIGLGLWYLFWRWGAGLNPEARPYSALVATAETAAWVGLVLFTFNLWADRPVHVRPLPRDRRALHLEGEGPVTVDVFVTTFDEDPELVRLSLRDARRLRRPAGVRVSVHCLDDGNRPAMARVAREAGARYITRTDNIGFKAGNIRNALLRTEGDFVIICDADTRLFPSFLEHTLGHFRDRRLAFVQTPHWFYDIPPDRPLEERLVATMPRLEGLVRRLPPWLRRLRGGDDPFGVDGGMFFDVILRRRNRHRAAFCCGAASIHRRRALLEGAVAAGRNEAARVLARLPETRPGRVLLRRDRLLRLRPLQPFRFHVSEDIFSSIDLHEEGWHSLLHPWIESRMLSPQELASWAAQRRKYAGGSMDIVLNDRPLGRRRLPLRHKLHYASTFWSYLLAPATLVLLMAPVFTLATGISPVGSDSRTFLLHLMPFLLMNEAALLVGCWGQNAWAGRLLNIACAPINLGAIVKALRKRQTRFVPTPKLPAKGPPAPVLRPHKAMAAALVLAFLPALVRLWQAPLPEARSALVLNGFWALSNLVALGFALRMARIRPPEAPAVDKCDPVPRRRISASPARTVPSAPSEGALSSPRSLRRPMETTCP